MWSQRQKREKNVISRRLVFLSSYGFLPTTYKLPRFRISPSKSSSRRQDAPRLRQRSGSSIIIRTQLSKVCFESYLWTVLSGWAWKTVRYTSKKKSVPQQWSEILLQLIRNDAEPPLHLIRISISKTTSSRPQRINDEMSRVTHRTAGWQVWVRKCLGADCFCGRLSGGKGSNRCFSSW